MRAAACVALAVAGVLTILIVADVRPDELVRVAGFQALFVLGPGLVLVRPLRTAGAAVRYGGAWTLGTVAASTLFLAGGAIGARAVVWILPVLTLVAAARSAAWRWRPRVPSTMAALGILVLCALGAGLAWVSLFGSNPLMRGLGSGFHYQDLVFHLAIAGEVLHHGLPFTDPSVAGEPLHYQILPHLDVAAARFVTGVDLEVLMWRTQPVIATAAAAALAGGVARSYGVGAIGGLLAAALVLFGGEIDLTAAASDFGNRALLGNDLLSPTQLLAVPVALTMLAALDAPAPRSAAMLAIWCLLGFGAMAAKVTVVPVLLGGLAFAFLVARARRALLCLAPGTAAAAAGAAVAYALLYAGSQGNGLALEPLAIAEGPDGVLPLGRVLLLPFVAVASAGGVIAYIALRRPPRDDWRVWVPVGALLASLLPYLLLDHPGQSQVYFLRTGLAVAAPLSGAGVAIALVSVGSPWRWIAAAAAALVVLPAVTLADADVARWTIALALVLAIAAAVAGGRPAVTAAVAGVMLAGLSLLDPVIDARDRVEARLRGETLVRPDDPVNSRGIAGDVREALLWLRDHSEADDVIAVNNSYITAAGDPRYFYYGAIAERRLFLGGWGYSDVGAARKAEGDVNATTAFPDRVALRNAAFGGDEDALQRLRDEFGVRYLFVDRRYGGDPPSGGSARLVHQSDRAAVYELDASR